MAFRSTREDWGTVAKTLHWAMAIGVLTMLACGVAMVWFLDGSLGLRFSVYQFHKSLGFVLLCLAAVRLSWRLVSVEKPVLPPDMKPYEHWLAAAVHAGLYVCLSALPLVGWAAASASPLIIPTTVFGFFTLPGSSARTLRSNISSLKPTRSSLGRSLDCLSCMLEVRFGIMSFAGTTPCAGCSRVNPLVRGRGPFSIDWTPECLDITL